MTFETPPVYERERRFLVADASITEGWQWVLIIQAYVFSSEGYAVRIRRIQEPDSSSPNGYRDLDATVAVKGPRIGDEREEYETHIDADLAAEIIKRSPHVVVKRRYQVFDGQAWDVDVFLEKNEGLIIAEIEGQRVREVSPPTWATREVTGELQFNNEELAVKPYARPKNTDDPLWRW